MNKHILKALNNQLDLLYLEKSQSTEIIRIRKSKLDNIEIEIKSLEKELVINNEKI